MCPGDCKELAALFGYCHVRSWRVTGYQRPGNSCFCQGEYQHYPEQASDAFGKCGVHFFLNLSRISLLCSMAAFTACSMNSLRVMSFRTASTLASVCVWSFSSMLTRLPIQVCPKGSMFVLSRYYFYNINTFRIIYKFH